MATSPTNVLPVDEVESLLICPICLETLNEPRTLPCFHSFCKVCLEKFVKRHREEAVCKDIEVFNCPYCRVEFTLKPKDEVAGMASSHFIRNMLDVMAIQRRAKVSKCSRCQEPAISRCTTCEMFMCEKCFEVHETWYGKTNKKHTVLSINELSQPENQAKIRAKLHCKKHENKSLKFYCETCKELVCRYCMDFQHVRPDNHLCLPLVEVAEKQREVLASRCTILEESLKEGNDTLELISNAKQSLEDNAKKAKKDITRQKEEVLKTFSQKLEEKAKLMMEEVEKKYKETHEPLVEQETEVKRHVDKVKGSFNLAKNLLEKGNDEEIISSQKMIAENIERMKQERPRSMPKPVHDGDIEYQSTPINDNDVATFLDKLGKVACRPAAVPCELRNTSIILNGHFEYGKQMVEWLDDHFQWRLCYRAGRDGWGAQDFHRCCDNKGPTVTLVKVGDYIFGGYTDQNWEGQGVWKQSNSSFLFSLKNKDHLPPFRCNIHRKQYAINSRPNYGPTFGGGSFGGGHDFHISNNSNVNQESYSRLGHTYQAPPGYQYSTEQTNSLLAGSYNFTPTEIEIFH